ncbi:MAG: hypothetical protein ACO22A_08165, partial [Schleiferiaceae bacterium]
TPASTPTPVPAPAPPVERPLSPVEVLALDYVAADHRRRLAAAEQAFRVDALLERAHPPIRWLGLMTFRHAH